MSEIFKISQNNKNTVEEGWWSDTHEYLSGFSNQNDTSASITIEIAIMTENDYNQLPEFQGHQLKPKGEEK